MMLGTGLPADNLAVLNDPPGAVRQDVIATAPTRTTASTTGSGHRRHAGWPPSTCNYNTTVSDALAGPCSDGDIYCVTRSDAHATRPPPPASTPTLPAVRSRRPRPRRSTARGHRHQRRQDHRGKASSSTTTCRRPGPMTSDGPGSSASTRGSEIRLRPRRRPKDHSFEPFDPSRPFEHAVEGVARPRGAGHGGTDQLSCRVHQGGAESHQRPLTSYDSVDDSVIHAAVGNVDRSGGAGGSVPTSPAKVADAQAHIRGGG